MKFQVIFNLNLVTAGWGISFKIVLRSMSLHLADVKSTLVQVMAWCRQATSHYLSQCWPSSLSSYGITRPQWNNKDLSTQVTVQWKVKKNLFFLFSKQSKSNSFTVMNNSTIDTFCSFRTFFLFSRNPKKNSRWQHRIFVQKRHDAPISHEHCYNVTNICYILPSSLVQILPVFSGSVGYFE